MRVAQPLTDEQKEFIKNNYLRLSYVKMAKMLGLKCHYKASHYCHSKGFTRRKTELSETDKQFIRDNYKTMKEKEICQLLGFTRIFIQKFKQSEGLAKYPGNQAKALRDVPVKKLFFNVDARECWVA